MRRTLIPLVLAAFFVNPSGAVDLARAQQKDDKDRAVVLRGHIVSLDEQGRRTDKNNSQNSNDSPQRFGLESSDGSFYRFLSSDVMTEMFRDARVRAEELQITALARESDQIEIVKVRAIREGKLYDIFYYCEVCSITAYGPGPCMCCGKEYELRETPVPEP